MNDYDIFDLIDKNKNDKLFNFSLSERKEFLYNLNNYLLEYRSRLNINSTFGIELEYENADCDVIKSKLQSEALTNWKSCIENSVYFGGEIVSPILSDDKKSWCDLTKYCIFLDREAEILKDAGTHIHIGSNILSKKDDIKTLLKFWYLYEDIIIRFSNGEFTSPRPDMNGYALPIRSSYLNILEVLDRNSYLKYVCSDKCKAISFKNVSFNSILLNNTIELRCPNGTFDSVIIQNNVNFFVKLISYVVNNDIDIDKLNYDISRILTSDKQTSVYNLINVDKALKLSDLIFDNNLDKIYFLRQYLKNNEVSHGYNRVKKFTT